LDFFSRREHQVLPSSPLIPKDDPSLLFTNAGMVQFKKVFLGQDKRGYKRAVTAQKCLRVGGKHNDLENVGRTARHHTFFEMLGNFSFADYFKEEAIRLAWEYLTQELGLPVSKLYASVFKDDEEAYAIWRDQIGLPQERIYRLDEKENFWSMGDTGPCGPCSELLIDQGQQMSCGPDCEIGVCECDRFLELWNLVFMQYDRDESGEMKPLPHPSIDTGMGLERIAAICQGVYSNFDTDLFSGLIQSMAYKAQVQYGQNPETDVALRVIADHSRAVSFMIADGILPSNEGRGYVLRRLIRRAFRFGSFLGLEEPFLYQVCGQLVGEMGQAYPELVQTEDFLTKVVQQEEENFGRTLDKGLEILDQELSRLKSSGQDQVPGEVVFKLYDTFGFPVDIVRDVAEKQGFAVDESGFQQLMQEQRQRSKATWAGSGEVDLAGEFADYLEAGWQTEFLGYETLQCSSRVVALLDLEGNTLTQAQAGQEVYVLTARTPFYGESGGQVGDQGRMLADTGLAEVVQTLKPAQSFIVHQARILQGEFMQDQEVNLRVDEGQRMACARNHTCTHLLHAALRKVLGQHVQQSGSLVSPTRLRFDFTHISALGPEELQEIEDRVNQAIFVDQEVQTREMDFAQAQAEEALGLFQEKYADQVRVVEVPGVSKELCGGTHLQRTGQAGVFCILSEAGVASGVRRIEAATAWNALEHFRKQREALQQACQALKTQPESLAHRVQEQKQEVKRLQEEIKELQSKQSMAGGGSILDQQKEINGIPAVATRVSLPGNSDMDGLRKIMDDLRTKMPQGAALLGSENQGKALLLLYISSDLHHKFTAPELIREVAKEVGGSGGGRPDLAQAGGSDPAGIESALQRFKELLQQK
jgi:alanyl-tRNA synthetase